MIMIMFRQLMTTTATDVSDNVTDRNRAAVQEKEYKKNQPKIKNHNLP